MRFRDNQLHWNKLIIPAKIRDNDLFVQEALLNKVKYCRIVKKPFKNGNKFFLQLIIGGIPPRKKINSTGEFRHKDSPNSRVGIDIGVSSIALCNSEEVILKELAPSSQMYEGQIRRLSRKLQRSRQANNPDNYKEDGTVKTGKLYWNNSNSYKKIMQELKNAYRLKANYIKLSHNKLANKIVSLGNEIYVEKMNFSALARKAKNASKNKKGKLNSRKRFGKAVTNKAPSSLITIVNKKLKYMTKRINEVNTWKFKASQYNHVDDIYTKKRLSERWNLIDSRKVQRDLYSAFLLKNSKDDLESTDRNLCIKNYDRFLVNHDICIEGINNSLEKKLSSFGL